MANKLVDVAQQLLGFGFGVGNHALAFTFGEGRVGRGLSAGHQAIGEVFGGTLKNLDKVFHGVALPCNLSPNSKLFKGLPTTIDVGRYHSWVITDENFPVELEVTARDENNMIMGLQHKTFDVQGVQFHPESVLTPLGETIIGNWLKS